MSVSGAFKDLDIFDIFENPYGEVGFPQEWLSKCKKPAPVRSINSKYSYLPGFTKDDKFGDFTTTNISPRRNNRGRATSKKTTNVHQDAWDEWYTDIAGGTRDITRDTLLDVSVFDIDIDLLSYQEIIFLLSALIEERAEDVATALVEEKIWDDIKPLIMEKLDLVAKNGGVK